MVRKKIALCLLLVSILIVGLALPLLISMTGIPTIANPGILSIDSKNPAFKQMKLVREGTVYSSTASINYVMRGYIDSDVNLELIVYSNETTNFKVTVVDSKTLMEQWSFQSSNFIDQIIPDNLDLDSPQEIVSVVQNTVTTRDNNGAVIWTKNYGEPVVATVVSDQNADGANDLLVFSTTVYGAYYWKYWIENVKDDSTIDSGNLVLPASIYPDEVLAINWDPSSTGDEIISFDEDHDVYPIVFINKNALGDLVVNKTLDLHDGWTEIDTIISVGRYISFCDVHYDGFEFIDRVVTIDTVAYTYWTCEVVGPFWYIRYTEIDGDPYPELFVDAFTGLLTFNIQSGVPIENLSAPYPVALPLDRDYDGIEECILYFDYMSPMGYDRLLDSTTMKSIASVKPPSTFALLFGYYPRDSEVVLIGLEYTYYDPDIVAIYSLRTDPTMMLILSLMSLSTSQQTQMNQYILLLIGGIAIGIISLAIILHRRGSVTPSPTEYGPPKEWKSN